MRRTLPKFKALYRLQNRPTSVLSKTISKVKKNIGNFLNV